METDEFDNFSREMNTTHNSFEGLSPIAGIMSHNVEPTANL